MNGRVRPRLFFIVVLVLWSLCGVILRRVDARPKSSNLFRTTYAKEYAASNTLTDVKKCTICHDTTSVYHERNNYGDALAGSNDDEEEKRRRTDQSRNEREIEDKPSALEGKPSVT